MLSIIALWNKILPFPDSKPENSFLQCDISASYCHAELFSRTKKLGKSELKATITLFMLRRSHEWKAGSQRQQFVESVVKQTEQKDSRLSTKKDFKPKKYYKKAERRCKQC